MCGRETEGEEKRFRGEKEKREGGVVFSDQNCMECIYCVCVCVCVCVWATLSRQNYVPRKLFGIVFCPRLRFIERIANTFVLSLFLAIY